MKQTASSIYHFTKVNFNHENLIFGPTFKTNTGCRVEWIFKFNFQQRIYVKKHSHLSRLFKINTQLETNRFPSCDDFVGIKKPQIHTDRVGTNGAPCPFNTQIVLNYVAITKQS